mmetsp:Transcript_67990/g.197029  ORF Transcript_67990/g.197029 Transcript_67990/m.197029 type:complete len:225 (-) Transcript_67990:855-1529(-)
MPQAPTWPLGEHSPYETRLSPSGARALRRARSPSQQRAAWAHRLRRPLRSLGRQSSSPQPGPRAARHRGPRPRAPSVPRLLLLLPTGPPEPPAQRRNPLGHGSGRKGRRRSTGRSRRGSLAWAVRWARCPLPLGRLRPSPPWTLGCRRSPRRRPKRGRSPRRRLRHSRHLRRRHRRRNPRTGRWHRCRRPCPHGSRTCGSACTALSTHRRAARSFGRAAPTRCV